MKNSSKKILLVNNFYYNRGGDCTYMFSLKELLEKKGHKVVVFSMNHPKNYDCEDSKYFVSHIDYAEEIKNKNISSGIRVLKKTFYSIEARRKIQELIRNEKPDIAHLHNIHHHLTPSILHVLKKNKIPILWTLHDYTIICPNTSLLAYGRICEKCKKGKYYWPLIVRCKKGSFAASTLAALETIFHRMLRIYNLVDVFITPSKFLRNKFIEFGFDKERLVSLDHFIDFPVIKEKIPSDNYYLYVGRISEEKGVRTLIDAAMRINYKHLKIVGEGPLLKELMNYVAENDKNGVIEFLGHKSRPELLNYYKKCKFIVVPSEWYENAGLIIFEAFACGKAVIGSNMGGIPELVKHMERGLIYEANNIEDLSVSIRYLLDNPDVADNMGENARLYIEQTLNADNHYQKLISLYNQVSS